MRRVLGTFGRRLWIKMLNQDNINYIAALPSVKHSALHHLHCYKASSYDILGFLAKEILQSQTQIQMIRATYYARMF